MAAIAWQGAASTAPQSLAAQSLTGEPWTLSSPAGDRGADSTGAASPWVNHALLLGTLFALDLPARSAAQRWQGDFGDDWSRWAERPGDWKRVLPIAAGGSLLLGWVTGGESGVARGLAVIVGTAAGASANEALNQIVGRGRPGWNEGAFHFRPFRGHSSFPSGHTGFAFALAGSIDGATDSPVAAALSYGVAGMVGLSRVYDDRHWLSDVVAAALLSGGVARRVSARVSGALRGHGEGASDHSAAGRAPGRVAGPTLVPLPAGVALRFEF